MIVNTLENKLMLQVASDLSREEGFREFAYPDPLSALAKKYRGKDYPWGVVPARDILNKIGKVDENTGKPWTVGYGFTAGTTPDSTIPKQLADRKLEALVLGMDTLLGKAIRWYEDSTFVTKTVLINLAFNMGLTDLLTFKRTLAAIQAKNYTLAAQNLRASLWYKQVGARAKELTARLETQDIEPQYKVG